MRCPRCRSPLTDIDDVHVCVPCGGAFLASAAEETVRLALCEEVHDTVSRATEAAFGPLPERPGALSCPTCTHPMRRYRVGPVEVDTCLEHGTWYDQGELAQVRDALLEGLPTDEVLLGEPAPPAALELARAPRRSPPRSALPRGGAVDPAALRRIQELQAYERARRHLSFGRGRRSRRGGAFFLVEAIARLFIP